MRVFPNASVRKIDTTVRQRVRVRSMVACPRTRPGNREPEISQRGSRLKGRGDLQWRLRRSRSGLRWSHDSICGCEACHRDSHHHDAAAMAGFLHGNHGCENARIRHGRSERSGASCRSPSLRKCRVLGVFGDLTTQGVTNAGVSVGKGVSFG